MVYILFTLTHYNLGTNTMIYTKKIFVSEHDLKMDKEFEEVLTTSHKDQQRSQQCEEKRVLANLQQYQQSGQLGHSTASGDCVQMDTVSAAFQEYDQTDLRCDTTLVTDQHVGVDEKIDVLVDQSEFQGDANIQLDATTVKQNMKMDEEDEKHVNMREKMSVLATLQKYEQTSVQFNTTLDSDYQRTIHQCATTAALEKHLNVDVQDQNKSWLTTPHESHETGLQCEATSVSDQNVNMDEKVENKSVGALQQAVIVSEQHIKLDEEDEQYLNIDEALMSVLATPHETRIQHDATLDSDHINMNEKMLVSAVVEVCGLTDHLYDDTMALDQDINLDNKMSGVADQHKYQHTGIQCATTLNSDQHLQRNGTPHEYYQTGIHCDQHLNTHEEDKKKIVLANLHKYQQTGLLSDATTVSEQMKMDEEDKKKNVFAASHEYQQRDFQWDNKNVAAYEQRSLKFDDTVVSEQIKMDEEDEKHMNMAGKVSVSAAFCDYHETGSQLDATLVSYHVELKDENINMDEVQPTNNGLATLQVYDQTIIQSDDTLIQDNYINIDEKPRVFATSQTQIPDTDTTLVSEKLINIGEQIIVLSAAQEYEQTVHNCHATIATEQHMGQNLGVLADHHEYLQTGVLCDTTLNSHRHIHLDAVDVESVLGAPAGYRQTVQNGATPVVSKQELKLDEKNKNTSVMSTLHEYQRAGHLCESMSLLANLHQYQMTANPGRHLGGSNVVSENHIDTELGDGQKSVLATVSQCQQTGHKCERTVVSEKQLKMDLKDIKKDVFELPPQFQLTGYLCDEMNMLSTLHEYQQTGHLCDVTLVSTEDREFVAHAVVLAAASSVLTQELSECDQGHYNILLPLNSDETNAFIQFAYTGMMNTSCLCDMSKVYHFCDRSDGQCHEKKIITKFADFSKKKLFSNVTWHNIISKIQPTNSILLAVRYNFMSQYMKTGSIVKINMLDSTYKLCGTYQLKTEPIYKHAEFECITCHKRYTRKLQHNQHDSVDIGDKQFKCDKCKKCSGVKVNSERLEYTRTNDLKKNQRGDKPHTCTTCYETFTTKYALKEHQSIYVDGCHYANVNPFMCQTCNKCFKTKKDLKRHKSGHCAAKPYKCALCEKRFKTSEHLKSHGRVHNNDRPYTCDKCEDRFKTKMEVRMHQTVHTNVKSYVCRKCNKRFKTRSGLRGHKQVHSDDRPYVCALCNKYYKAKEHLERHNKHSHSDVKPYMCTTCNKCFVRKVHLQQHGAVHSTERPYTCKLCKKSFKSKGDFRLHEYIHTGEKLYCCKICKTCFISRFKLKQHGLLHTEDRPYPCVICDKSFKSQPQLKLHGRVHSDVRPYKCNECDKRFKTKPGLKKHGIIHNRDTPHRCATCNKTFISNSRLKDHQSIHTAKPYFCTTCSKCFITNMELKLHDSSVHSGGRPYICLTCEKDFATRKQLRMHERAHSDDRPFMCKICNKCFKTNEKLTRHGIVHNDDRPYKCEICGNFSKQSIV